MFSLDSGWQLRASSSQLSAISSQFPVPSHESPVPSSQFPVPSSQFPVASRQLITPNPEPRTQRNPEPRTRNPVFALLPPPHLALDLALVQCDMDAVARRDAAARTDDRGAIGIPAHRVAAAEHGERAEVLEPAGEREKRDVGAVTGRCRPRR